MELVLEVLTRNGKVKDFYKLDKPQVSIGRAYDNDIVLKDQFVCPHHVTLSVKQEQVILHDLDSINGIKSPNNKALDTAQPLTLNQIFLLGNQLMRVVSSQSQSLAGSIKMTALEYFSQNSNRWYWAVLSILAVSLLMVFDAYLAKYTEIIWSKLLVSNGLFPAIFILGIGIVLAVAATLFKKDVKFFTSLLVVACGFILIQLSFSFVGILRFNLGDGLLIFVVNKVLLFSFFYSALWAAMFFATHLSTKKISVIALVLTLSGQGIQYLYNNSGDKVNLYPRYPVAVFPESFLVNPAVDVSTWVDKSQNIYEKAAEDAQRRNDEN